MKLEHLAKDLSAHIVHRSTAFNQADVESVMASDLMSDVLVTDRGNLLLVTSLASDQAVRTADIVGAVGVLVVNDKTLPAPMKTLAADLDMALLRVKFSTFETCVRIGALLEPPADPSA